MRNYCYVAVCSAALGASAPTEGGEGRGHILEAARLQLVKYIFQLQYQLKLMISRLITADTQQYVHILNYH